MVDMLLEPASSDLTTFRFHSFYRTQVYLGSDLWVRVPETMSPCVDLTDVTLVDEDTKSIPTDDVKGQSLVMCAAQCALIVMKAMGQLQATLYIVCLQYC